MCYFIKYFIKFQTITAHPKLVEMFGLNYSSKLVDNNLFLNNQNKGLNSIDETKFINNYNDNFNDESIKDVEII